MNKRTVVTLIIAFAAVSVVALSVVGATMLVAKLSSPQRDDTLPTLSGGRELFVPDDGWDDETYYEDETVFFGDKELPVLGGVDVNEYDPSLFSFEDGRLIYSGPERTFFGIDVSAHQDIIDWDAVASDGVEFAIIRAAWRGNTEGKLHEDDCFRQNIQGALAAGIDVGVYLFSQAITLEEAQEEAEFLIELIEDYDVTYPVVFDWEFSGSDTRTADITPEMLNACANRFCQVVAHAGYTPMIYFYRDIAYNHFDLSKIDGYDFWLAEYDGAPTFHYHFEMLQYSSTGSVDGIEGDVDLNLSFVNYAEPVGKRRTG